MHLRESFLRLASPAGVRKSCVDEARFWYCGLCMPRGTTKNICVVLTEKVHHISHDTEGSLQLDHNYEVIPGVSKWAYVGSIKLDQSAQSIENWRKY
ncbi:hypothetical protein PAXRUDRAFT_499545 [Paxillus rubicundulus Ve08.2h10]|uniref:Uncharacterized protein n=1 Tax=Paxillus rubicundulus Ve08.2h10 TaxID=930991 RepID=A0A0D0BV08_9AGAM|nr:hypothetical protein PAXRUDRAFT_499545 [Paxillus rubicundulus Ve08.2h10]